MNGSTDAKHKQTSDSDGWISVQKYTGQGYSLDGGEETGKIAKAHKQEIDQAVQKFFLKKYKTKVIVHNLVGNKDGATAFVESVGELHFFTYCIVPINVATKKIAADHIFTEEGQVDGAIRAGIYAMIYQKEFENLDNYFKSMTKKYPIVGLNKKAVANVGGDGYSTPYYTMLIPKEGFGDDLYHQYINEPNRNPQQWREKTKDTNAYPKMIFIAIECYMKKPDQKPSKKNFQQMISDLKKMPNIPSANYRITLNNNEVDESSGGSDTTYSLETGTKYGFIKY